MISRYSLCFTRERLEKHLAFKSKIEGYKRTYNISPKKESYILIQKNGLKIRKAFWGLVPSTARKPEVSGTLFNAHCNGISAKNSFRIPIRESRCIILADSFYVTTKNNETLRLSAPDQSILWLAGVYEIWQSADEQIRSFSMLIKNAMHPFDNICSYLPLAFAMQQRDFWLDDQTPLPDIIHSLDDYTSPELKYYRITDRIADTSYDSPDIHEKYNEEMTLFDPS